MQPDDPNDSPRIADSAIKFDMLNDGSRTEGMSRRSSYSLLLLFYLTTMSAIVAAAGRLAFATDKWSLRTFLIGYLVTLVATIAMCMTIGFLIGRTWVSTLLGLLAGLLCGLVAILMILVQPVHYESAGLILGAGCWIMTIIAILGNRWQKC